jgi:glycosyltransferase involved in cell wall biosynthesis
MRLVCAWHNPWPQLVVDSLGIMMNKGTIRNATLAADNQRMMLDLVLRGEGIPAHAFQLLGPLSQPDLAAVMNQTDLGVFPNRCEGGTNLVAMEYLSCGKPALLSAGTGHVDILKECASAVPLFGETAETGWVEVSPVGLEMAIEGEMDDPSSFGPEGMSHFTWERAARTIVDAVLEYQ